MSEIKIAVVGECMIEISGEPFSQLNQSFGGDSMNTAIYLKTLAQDDVDVHFVSSMGRGKLNKALINKWKEYGIDTSSVLINAEKNAGLYMIENDAHGERTFQYWRNDSAAKYMVQHPGFDDVINKLFRFDAIYLSGISLAILPAKDCKALLFSLKTLSKAGVKIIFDSNYRPSLWSSIGYCKRMFKEIYQLADLALVTFDDEEMLWNDSSIKSCRKRLHKLGIKELVIKDGANGCQYSQLDNNSTYEAQTYPTSPVNKVIDTTAAGDSFNAGFLFGWLQDKAIVECAQIGNALAGQVIQSKGAIVSIDITELPIEPSL